MRKRQSRRAAKRSNPTRANLQRRDSRKKIPTADYRRYMESPEWSLRRTRFFSRSTKVCEACGTNINLQVHHRTYVNFGNEEDQDLRLVCQEHHTSIHRLEREHGYRLDRATDLVIDRSPVNRNQNGNARSELSERRERERTANQQQGSGKGSSTIDDKFRSWSQKGPKGSETTTRVTTQSIRKRAEREQKFWETMERRAQTSRRQHKHSE